MPTKSINYCGRNMVANQDADVPALWIFSVNSPLNKKYEKQFVSMVFPGAKQVQGCYNNEMEWSYIIEAHEGIREKLYDFLGSFNQESVMFVDEKRVASLYYVKLEASVEIGQFQITSPADAMDNHEGWTRDGSTFWVVK